MEPEKQPTQMVLDQINLLKSEERKLRKFIEYNRDAKNIVEVHLREIQSKKNRLYNLCNMMGITVDEEADTAVGVDDEPAQYHKIPQPTGRFGSVLINWHSGKTDY